MAQIVDREFLTYDADSSGDLNTAEFATWMTNLRVASDPNVNPESEQVKNWIGEASAIAGSDKSGGLARKS